jgi:hypothetical protein
LPDRGRPRGVRTRLMRDRVVEFLSPLGRPRSSIGPVSPSGRLYIARPRASGGGAGGVVSAVGLGRLGSRSRPSSVVQSCGSRFVWGRTSKRESKEDGFSSVSYKVSRRSFASFKSAVSKPSVKPSSIVTEADCGRLRTYIAAPCFSLRCLRGRKMMFDRRDDIVTTGRTTHDARTAQRCTVAACGHVWRAKDSLTTVSKTRPARHPHKRSHRSISGFRFTIGPMRSEHSWRASARRGASESLVH